LRAGKRITRPLFRELLRFSRIEDKGTVPMRATVLRSVGLVLFAAAGSLSAQEPNVKVQPYWDTDVGVGIQYSLFCVGAMPPPTLSQPWGVLIARELASSDQNPLSEWKFVFEKALPLDEDLLDVIQDGQPLPDIRAKELRELTKSDRAIYFALSLALRRADQATQDMFERSAADNSRILYADLNKQPGDHRGKVVSVKGELIAIREVDAPRPVSAQLRVAFAAFIRGPTKGAPPYTVLFTELPAGLAIGEQQSAVVTMHGYFLGLIRFQADKENRDRQKDVISPYLVGKTLVVNSKGPEKAAQESHSYWLIITGLSGFVLMTAFGAVALLWLKRGDRKIQAHLAQMRDKHAPFSLEPGEEGAAPPNPEAEFKNGAH
jgi:hypothetical protein